MSTDLGFGRNDTDWQDIISGENAEPQAGIHPGEEEKRKPHSPQKTEKYTTKLFGSRWKGRDTLPAQRPNAGEKTKSRLCSFKRKPKGPSRRGGAVGRCIRLETHGRCVTRQQGGLIERA